MHGVFNVTHFYSEAVRFVVWNHMPRTQSMPHLIQTHKCKHTVQNENTSKLLLSWCHLGMMGISCSDKLAVSFTNSTPVFKAWSCCGFTPFSFTSQRCTQITETLMPFDTHTSHFFPLTTFLLHYSCLLFLLFFNSSLFSAHVYFYLSVHGRSQRNDEAWETCSSPWQLYCKPLLSNIAPPHPHIVYICSTYLIIRFVQVSISARSLTGRSVEVLFLNYYFFLCMLPRLDPPRCPPLTSPFPPGADWAVFSSLNQWACCCGVILH